MSPLRFRIRELRIARQWSQAQLADKAKVRQGTISGLETGLTRRVDLDVLERIGAALGVDPASLLVNQPRTSSKRPARRP